MLDFPDPWQSEVSFRQACRNAGPHRGNTSRRYLELSSWQPGAAVISWGLASFRGIADPGKLGTDGSFVPLLLPSRALDYVFLAPGRNLKLPAGG